MNKKPLTYRDAGVDIHKAEESLNAVKAAIRRTHTPEVLTDIGLFGGFFRLPEGYKNPVLVASTDGVGTKIKIAIQAKNHQTIGEDLVNHCINDIARSAKNLRSIILFVGGIEEKISIPINLNCNCLIKGSISGLSISNNSLSSIC